MHQGELLAVLGANGSGKSTTCHVLCGITPPTAGDALVDDKISLLDANGPERLVGWCPQRDILFDELTPLEHVRTLLAELTADVFVCCDSRCRESGGEGCGRGAIEEGEIMASTGWTS